MENDTIHQVDRRAFFKDGALLMTALVGTGSFSAEAGGADEKAPVLTIGLVTDVHYADKDPGGTRYYRESLSRFKDAVSFFNSTKVDFTVELGDFVDSADTVEGEIEHLATLEREYRRLNNDRHYVLGNHCVHTLTKDQFFENCGGVQSYYSFDKAGFHFVVLDACFRPDGVPYGNKNFDWTDPNLPPEEIDWLEKDLAESGKPTVVFIHQRLDVDNDFGVKNGARVRAILEASGRVLAVFQGHNHINEHKDLEGIHYCTLAAMVEGAPPENSAYGLLKIHGDRSLTVEGFWNQNSYSLP